METIGYAVVVDGDIDMRTVSQHQRAAKVNWLWVNGVRVTDNFSDVDIEYAWDKRRRDFPGVDISVRQVSVTVREGVMQ